jgi:hypothetical protein
METLIGIFSAVFSFFGSIGGFFADLGKSVNGSWGVEMMLLAVMTAVAISGMAAFGPWTRKRRPDEYPWQ